MVNALRKKTDSAITWKETTFLSVWETGIFLGTGEKTLIKEKLDVFFIQNYRCFHTFIFLITFFKKLSVLGFSQFFL